MSRVSPLLHGVRDRALPLAASLARRPARGNPQRILLLQPDHLGDVLLAQPALRALRAARPADELIAVVGPWSSEIARLAWPVDQVIELSFPGFTRATTRDPSAPYRQLAVEAKRLRALDAGIAVVLRADGWWAAWLASLVAPQVIGSDDPRLRPFVDVASPLPNDAHAVERALAIVAPLAAPGDHALSLIPTVEGRAAARQGVIDVGITRPFAVVHPGSGAAVKSWPVARWVSVVVELAGRGLDVVVTGGPSERAVAERIAASHPRARSLAGLTSVGELATLLSVARIVVGPDSGPLHVAVAVGTPSVHLFGPSDPDRWGPWGDPGRHRVVSAGWHCPRCGDLSPGRPAGCGCMLAIAVEDVMDVVDVLLAADGAA